MGFRACAPFHYPSHYGLTVSGFGSFSSVQLAANTERFALMLRSPIAGDISKIFARTATVTTGNANCKSRLEGIDAGTFLSRPDGSLLAGSAEVTKAIADADDNLVFECDHSGSMPTVTRGQRMSWQFGNPGAGSLDMNLARLGQGALAFPHANRFTGGAWSTSSGSPYTGCHIFGMLYNVGGVDVFPEIPGCYPISAVGQTAFNDTTNPDEVGTRVMMPPCKVGGWWAWMDADAGEQYDVCVYNSPTNKIHSTAEDGDIRCINSGGFQTGWFTDEITIESWAEYFLTFRNNTSTSIDLQHMDCGGVLPAIAMDGFHGGKEWYYVARQNDTGSLLTAANTTRKIIAGFIVTALLDSDGVFGQFGGMGLIQR